MPVMRHDDTGGLAGKESGQHKPSVQRLNTRFTLSVVMPPELYPGGDVHHDTDKNRQNRQGKAARVGLGKACEEDCTEQAAPE